MTLLNTLSNLGGTWPRYFVLLAVDYLTDAPCTMPALDGSAITCTSEQQKSLCKSVDGTCTYVSDGFYIVNTLCVIFGVVSLTMFIIPQIRRLERLPLKSWRIKKRE